MMAFAMDQGKQGQQAHGPLSSYNLLCICRSQHRQHRSAGVDTGSAWSFPQLYAALCGRAAALMSELHAQLLALGHRVFRQNSDTPAVEIFSPETAPLNEHTKPHYGSTPDELEASSSSPYASDTGASAVERENAVLAQLMNAVVHINERVISLEDLVFSQPIQIQLSQPVHEQDGDDTGSNTSSDECCVAIADDSMEGIQQPLRGDLQQEIVGELADYCALLNGRLAQLEACVAPSAGKSKSKASSSATTVSALMAFVLALNDRLCAFEDALHVV